jgi:DNA polymerase-3 subunit beta
MKATLNLKSLRNNIKKAYRLLPKRSSHPLLDCFLLTFKNNLITITATDLFSGIKITQETTIEEEGVIAVNGKFFYDLINSLDSEEIKISSFDEEKNKIVLETKKEKINLPVFDYQEYPDIGTFDSNDQEISILKEEIIKINNLITFAVSSDLNKPIFNSFYFNLDKEKSVVVGTDSVRLTYLNLETKAKKNKKFLIPKKNFNDLLFIVNETSNLSITLFYKEKENLIFIKNNKDLYFTKLNSGEYPPYEKIIPEENDFKIIIDKNDLLKTLKKLSFFVRDNSNISKLRIKEEKIEFLAQSNESGKYEGEISIVNKSKNKGVIAFNILYLLDYLNSIKGEEVEMMFSGSNKPALFADLSEKNSKHLVMPFALND